MQFVKTAEIPYQMTPKSHTSHDENSFGAWMLQHGGVHKQLVVNLLVTLCALHFPVEEQHFAERGRVDEIDLLELTPTREQDAGDAIRPSVVRTKVFLDLKRVIENQLR